MRMKENSYTLLYVCIVLLFVHRYNNAKYVIVALSYMIIASFLSVFDK